MQGVESYQQIAESYNKSWSSRFRFSGARVRLSNSNKASFAGRLFSWLKNSSYIEKSTNEKYLNWDRGVARGDFLNYIDQTYGRDIAHKVSEQYQIGLSMRHSLSSRKIALGIQKAEEIEKSSKKSILLKRTAQNRCTSITSRC